LVFTEVIILVAVQILDMANLTSHSELLSYSVLVLLIISLFTLAGATAEFRKISLAAYFGVSLTSLWGYQLSSSLIRWSIETTNAQLQDLMLDTVLLSLILCFINFIMVMVTLEEYRRRIVDFIEGIFEAIYRAFR